MVTQRVVLVRHGDGPADDRVVTFLERTDLRVETRRPFKGDALGPVDGSVAATVVYGGPFTVTDTDAHPFLVDEARWIEACMRRDLPVLGICQGAQAIAALLGARVGPLPGEPHEFGYYPVYGTPAARDWFPEVLHVAQAHFHGFDLPSGAELIATGETFAHQAFRYGARTFALQFHPEVTIAGFRRWQEADWARYGKPGAQSRDRQDALARTADPAQDRWFTGFLARLFEGRTGLGEARVTSAAPQPVATPD